MSNKLNLKYIDIKVFGSSESEYSTIQSIYEQVFLQDTTSRKLCPTRSQA